MNDNIYKLLEEKEFTEKILIMKTPEEIQKAFLDKGVKISIEELEELAKNISKIINNPHANEEITDSEAENISGGINIHKGLRTAAAIIAGVGVGGSAMYIALKAGNAIDNANKAIDNADGALEGARGGWLGWFCNMNKS